MIQIIFIFLLSFSAWSVDIGLEFSVPEIKQGSLTSALIKIDAVGAQEVPPQKLRSKTFADTIYIYEMGTPIRKEGRPYFEAEAKIIFIKVPETNELSFAEDGKSFKIFWNAVTVLPTKADKSFMYGAFSAPARFQAFKWGICLLCITLLLVLIFWINRKYQSRAIRKKHLSDLKKKLIAPSNYFEIVDVWMNRQSYLTTFPLIEESFRNLEQKLFKVQFKPHQSEQEKEFIVESYKDFLISIKGPLDGI